MSSVTVESTGLPTDGAPERRTSVNVLFAISLAHLLNDTIQSLMPALYPVLKETHRLSFQEIGLITFTFQFTASLLQPVVGLATDRKPRPFSLAVGMGVTLGGLLLLAQATQLSTILLSAGLIGVGSSVFHPEASRVARLASGGRHGLAQSLFQVGGNLGSSLGPLLAAWIVVPHGQGSLSWFSIIACLAIVLLFRIGQWYRDQLHVQAARTARHGTETSGLPTRTVVLAIGILLVLVVSKFFYLVSLTNYYTFYLMDRFGVSVQAAQLNLFVFLFAIAAGTIAGGPLGDRFGRKFVLWISILGVAPFSLAMPHLDLTGTVIVSAIAGFILASAFPAILVYAQELLPGRVGLVAGLFFGLAFGMSGIASALLGMLADYTSIRFVFAVCAYLPLFGLFIAFLPSAGQRSATGSRVA